MTRPLSWVSIVVCSLAVLACTQPESTRWNKKAAEVEEGRGPQVDKSTVEAGQSLNAFFPSEDGNLSRTFTQEKLGFVEAELVQDSKTAKTSISDTNNNPPAREKFKTATDRLADHPLVEVGKRQSAVLVAGRWQVKVSSSDFDASERRVLLERFNLAGLSAFRPGDQP